MTDQVRKLDDNTLLDKTKSLALVEREITLEILHHLREIFKRRLFALRGFNSIFDYATTELGYSPASAQRRLSAMRLLTEIPEVEGKIQSGELTLTNAAQAQKLFHSEEKVGKPISTEEKKAILNSLENKSTREAEKDLLRHSSQPIALQKPDAVKPLTPTHSEVRFLADQNLMNQLELIRGFLAHKHPSLSLCELFTEMAKLSLGSLQPKVPKSVHVTTQVKAEANTQAKAAVQAEVQAQVEVKVEVKTQVDSKSVPLLSRDACVDGSLAIDSGAGVFGEMPGLTTRARSRHPIVERSRYIPVEVKRAVYQRDGGMCCFVDPVTSRRCGSRRAIQYDHIRPFAQGGQSTVENIRLACDVHNRIFAVISYGSKHMSKYLHDAESITAF